MVFVWFIVICSLIVIIWRALHDLWCYPHFSKCTYPNCYFKVSGSLQGQVTQAMTNHKALHDLDWGD